MGVRETNKKSLTSEEDKNNKSQYVILHWGLMDVTYLVKVYDGKDQFHDDVQSDVCSSVNPTDPMAIK